MDLASTLLLRPVAAAPRPRLHSLRRTSTLALSHSNLTPRIALQPMPHRRLPVLPVRASRGEAEVAAAGVDGRIAVGSAVTILFAVANRVLYKLALVPMKHFPFFLAQFTTFGYVAVYFSILFVRYRAGIVTKDMLALPKSLFMAIGGLEALGVASGMSAGAMLPGPAIPILSQTFLVWQLIFSVLVLGRRYAINQVFGCLLVTAGVAIAVARQTKREVATLWETQCSLQKKSSLVYRGTGKGQFLSDIEFIWPALMVASSAFQAAASILKEFAFLDGSKRLQGKPPDIFVVNSFGSAFQALFVFLLLPFLSNLRGIRFTDLPAYLMSGAACFLNIGKDTTGCEGAPFLPLLFITINMAFNISLLNLVKMSSALVSSLASTLSVPVSIYILSLPLPFIPQGSTLSTNFVIGTAVLVLGLLLYNFRKPTTEFSKSE